MKNNYKDNYILGIESSCDDTSVAVIKNDTILSNFVANQKIHELYGGVVPELASRAHLQNIIPVVDSALKKAGISKNQLSAIAFTRGPGLLGSLLVGTSFAKALSMSLDIPMIEVNHMRGHILAHFIQESENPTERKEVPSFPFICLTVSGGHTQLVLVKSFDVFEIIGQTKDDAAGEAFDKAAKLLNLPYPGGPLVDKYAQLGDASKFEFTFPQIEEFNYSFSGLKTQFMYFLEKNKKLNPNFVEENLNDICASYQKHIVTYLFKNLIKAAEKYKVKEIAIAGGVSANSELRARLIQTGIDKKWNTYIPKFEYCTDNAAMIAITGYYKYLNGEFCGQDVAPLSRYAIDSL
jgi:N6-L-threonylcarbamoyladenine synthase